MNKELFLETIGNLERQRVLDDKCNEAFGVLLSNDYVTGYDNTLLEDQLMKVLKIAMNDNHAGSWIDYFVYELDFGKDYEKGKVTIDSKPVVLRTASHLWELLLMS